MAILAKALRNDFLDNILPTYGNERAHVPTWDNSQKMFICDEYETTNGNRHYRGVRFCDRIVIIENVGTFHCWTYIDSIELYAFNGRKLKLIQKRDYENVFRKEEFIRNQSVDMVKDYLHAILKIQRTAAPVDQQAQDLVNRCYKSFLDEDFNTRITQILPAIELR